ncbi:hypothetical protein B0T17DRAFT_241664 [Bombardia bombarda]|uniref:Copper acquisition factor BIM1-like domain-containing protein n=1 Tax=Bombardia bombarda TaxID=252184 RepID=A0AA40CAI7_9PEZI|nr:hypothetical protein B0T17DRAFT_241664 [Bombardia bombarda]
MAPLRSLAAATLLFLSAANAHFTINSPVGLEGSNLDDDKEGNAPCGALNADLSQTTTNDFHVDGDFIALTLGHPQANWLFRGTLDPTSSNNWTQLFPILTQSGLGDFCEPAVTAPKAWAGKKGIIGIACDGPDGILYQCALVNFVSGSNTPGDACKNATTVTADFNDDALLSALVSNPTNSSSGSSTTGSAPTSSTTAAGNAAPALARGEFPLGSLAVAAVMAVIGGTLL